MVVLEFHPILQSTLALIVPPDLDVTVQVMSLSALASLVHEFVEGLASVVLSEYALQLAEFSPVRSLGAKYQRTCHWERFPVAQYCLVLLGLSVCVENVDVVRVARRTAIVFKVFSCLGF